MGQDISVVFAPVKIGVDTISRAAHRAFANGPPDNLVALICHSGPTSLSSVFPEHTGVSLWTDVEGGLSEFAAELSKEVGKVVVLTMADHACVGGWQAFENGQPGPGNCSMADDYTEYAIQGIEQTFGVSLQPDEDERLFFVEQFLGEVTGVCILGKARGFKPGKTIKQEQIEAILETDLPDCELECLLLAGD